MRQFLFFCCLLASTCFSNDEQQAIIYVMKTQEKAWNQGDLNEYMQGYWQSDKLQFVGKNGIKYGWQATLDNYKKSYPDKATMGTLNFDILSVEVENSSAFVLGKWHLKRIKDELSGFYTLYWKKIDGQWRIVIDHSS